MNVVFNCLLGIVAVDRGVKGIYFYHEPTKASWANLPVYPNGNNVLVRAQPAMAGFAMIRRSGAAPNGWEILVQDANGLMSGGVTAFPV